jgi:uncharacterized membrane protein YbhN (UPF0104 family)
VRGRLLPVLQLLAGAGILAALAARLGAEAFVAGLAAIGPGSVLAALAIGLLTTVSSAGRWCLVARGLGLRLPLAGAVADTYRAVLLNSVLPAGVLGDVHRAVSYGRRVGDVGRGARVVALERVAGQAAVVVVGVAVLLAHPSLLALATGHGGAGALVAAGLLGAVGALTLAATRGPRAARVRTWLRRMLAEARAGVLGRGTWPGVVALSAAALAGYLALFLVAARAAGSQAAVADLLPLLMLGLLAMAIPLNLGGWGPREGVTTAAFGAVGFGATQGLTTAVVYGVLSLIACLPGIAVLLWPLLQRLASRRRAVPPTTVGRVPILVPHDLAARSAP